MGSGSRGWKGAKSAGTEKMTYPVLPGKVPVYFCFQVLLFTLLHFILSFSVWTLSGETENDLGTLEPGSTGQKGTAM